MIRKLVPFAAFACLLMPTTQARADYQGCVNQCYQTYNARWLYCIERYGGHGYDAELCMLNEHDVLTDCVNNCSTTYGFNTGKDNRAPRFLARQASCQGQSGPMAG
jgi:hypothetical protein